MNLSNRTVRIRSVCGVLAMAWLLAACSTSSPKLNSPLEKFGSVDTYSRLIDATPAATCEAARRALLSQGYKVDNANAELVEGTKNFQPEAEAHLQMTIRVVCAPDSSDGQISLAFVSAVQDRYALKKASSSASLGVGALGSVSLPLMAASEAMIKVGSETITSAGFYDSFFALVKDYLAADAALQK